MIEIKGIGFYDESKNFFEQEDEKVREYLEEKSSSFNFFTAIEFDTFKRPVRWRYEGEGVVIESTRTYKTNDVNYFIDKQKYTIYGSI